MHRATLFAAIWAVWAVCMAPGPSVANDTPTASDGWRASETAFATQMQQLAEWCDQRGLADQAAQTREWVAMRDPLLWYVPKLPSQVQPHEPPEGAGADQAEWFRQFWDARKQQGERLLTLAEQAVGDRDPPLARTLLLEACRQDPDNDQYRELLGFKRYRGEWLSQWQVRQISQGYVWHDRFGWLRNSQVERYEQGLRHIGTLRVGGRLVRDAWVSAERDAEARRDIENGWVVETEHYRVQTNDSLEEGVRLARKLEELNWVWREMFFRVWATPGEQAAVLKPPRSSTSPRRHLHDVVYFGDKQQYVDALRSAAAGDITQSTGIYFGNEQKAYFFAGSEYSEITLLHEATHQLFSEVNPQMRAQSGKPRYWDNLRWNFWIVEGIACYMETLTEHNGYYVIGGTRNDRLRAAAYRALELDWYKPLAELTNYGMLQLVRDPEIAAIYSQATGLTTFLLHGQDARYRDALLDYIRLVYTAGSRPDSLSQLTGESYETLDQQYKEFLKNHVKIRE